MDKLCTEDFFLVVCKVLERHENVLTEVSLLRHVLTGPD